VERAEQQAHLAIGWQAPSLSNPDSFALDLVATILGGSESARLQKTLRDGERLVSGINVTNSSMQLAGIVYVQAQLEAADVEKAEQRILEEIARLQREGPTDEERKLAVTKAESEHAFAYETTDGVASAYGTHPDDGPGSRTSCATSSAFAPSRANRSGTPRAGICP